MSVQYRLSELVDYLSAGGYISCGKDTISNECKDDITISGFSSIYDSQPGTLSWMKDQNIDWTEVKASVILCQSNYIRPKDTNIIFLRSKNPRLAFVKALTKFYPFNNKRSIESTAIIGSNCSIGKDVYIGHYSVIGDNVTVGENTKINSHVSVYDNCIIGASCIIYSGTVIGADGFGFEKDFNGSLIKFPHLGRVLIGDNVEVGSNTCIDRGALSATIIDNNVKIDNLCQIGHNVKIGENTIITAACMIGGSIIGKNCWIAPNASIREGLTIGDGAFIGLGSVVVKDVCAHDVVAGVPAKSIKKVPT